MSAGPLLLDTHAFIWWATNDPRLSSVARAAVGDSDATVLVSVVTPWEMTIKRALGRLELSESPRALVYGQLARNDFRPLAVELEHVLGVAELPLHHGDPFDRLLIAQAQVEGAMLVSGDDVFVRYGLEVVW